MTLTEKKNTLLNYFREHSIVPRGMISIDNDTETVGNVSVNGTWYGVFDYVAKKFIQLAE